MALKDHIKASGIVHLIINFMCKENKMLRLLGDEGKKFWVIPPDKQFGTAGADQGERNLK